MDNSILYGLRNPAMTDDIGMTMIERQFPTNINSYTGNLNGVQINSGQPQSDTYQNKRKKEYAVIATVIGGLGLAVLGYFGYKKGVKGVTKVIDYIKNIDFKDALSKCKTSIVKIFKR